jgi:hypothetical protein
MKRTTDDVGPDAFDGAPVTIDGRVVGHITGVTFDEAGIFASATIADTDEGRAAIARFVDPTNQFSVPAFPDAMTGFASIGPIPTKPERCPSCNAIIDPFNGACRCFD